MSGVYSKLPGVKSLFSPLDDLLEPEVSIYTHTQQWFSSLRLCCQLSSKAPFQFPCCSAELFLSTVLVTETQSTQGKGQR